MNQRKNNKAFTLIELLVIISIIGLLSSIILVRLESARSKAKISKVTAELTQFIQVSVIAQQENASRLQNITNSGCSDCICRGRDIRNIPTSDVCYIQWINALTNIQTATKGAVSNLTNLTRDVWGSPYALDENEREFGPLDCRQDTILSVGPNGLWEGVGSGDDIGFYIPFFKSCP